MKAELTCALETLAIDTIILLGALTIAYSLPHDSILAVALTIDIVGTLLA
jgi:hypothetical protein